MAYCIDYHGEAVQRALLQLPPGLQARYVALVQRMEQYGANLGEPHTKALGDGLFELRLKSSEGIARVLYCTLPGQGIVMLHCFVKKTQKIPITQLQIAIARMQEAKHAHAQRTGAKNAARPEGQK